MANITYNGEVYNLQEDETVLDGLTRQGQAVPFSCKNGTCQTCMMQALDGNLPEGAQKGLKDTLKAQNYFLACSCRPQSDLEVALPGKGAGRLTAVVQSIRPLSPDIVCVGLNCPEPVQYRAGQFINLFKEDALARSYSLASLPSANEPLQLHVRRVPDGRVSGWIHADLQPGDAVEISNPAGDCFYVPGHPEQPLLLIGTGSGLAPLYGIVRDALAQGHTGPIRLYHGSRTVHGLYLVDELRELEARYPNFSYTPCLSGPDVPADYAAGRALDVALQAVPKLAGWRVFLCGNPDMVKTARKKAFLAGVSMKDIFADAFTRAAA